MPRTHAADIRAQFEQCIREDGTMNIEIYDEFFKRNRLDDCPLLAVGTPTAEWFNNRDTFMDESKTVYPKPEGLMDPFYLAHLFQTIERNIIRIALTRSQPGFKKTAGEAVTKLIVGNLQASEKWKSAPIWWKNCSKFFL